MPSIKGKSRIPRSFRLMGMTITVRFCDLPDSESGGWSMTEQEIKIDRSQKEDSQLQTFWHEAFHACLDTMSYDKLSSDEKFVDRIGHCLAQIDLTRQ